MECGVPGPTPTAFLPGAPWLNVRDLLHDALRDLHRVAVQDYVLHANEALHDVDVLASRAFGAQVNTKRTVYDVGGTIGTCDHLVCFMPAREVDDISVGVALERCGVEKDAERLMRYVVNAQSASCVTLALHGDVVELALHRSATICCMLFERRRFVAAFRRHRVDFARLEHALLRCTHGEYAGAPGAIRFRSHIAEYRDAAVCASFTVAASCCVEPHAAAHELRALQHWGVRHLLTNNAPPPRVLPPPAAACRLVPLIRRRGPAVPARRAVHIAPDPARARARAPAPAHDAGPNADDDEAQQKRLRRQIKKREAAMRSHAKRKANRCVQ